MEKTCFFIGSRHATNRIQPQLAEAVDKHIIEYGVTIFTVGHYGSFDSLVIAVLNKTKNNIHTLNYICLHRMRLIKIEKPLKVLTELIN